MKTFDYGLWLIGNQSKQDLAVNWKGFMVFFLK